jgi:hypothetical protein
MTWQGRGCRREETGDCFSHIDRCNPVTQGVKMLPSKVVDLLKDMDSGLRRLDRAIFGLGIVLWIAFIFVGVRIWLL